MPSGHNNQHRRKTHCLRGHVYRQRNKQRYCPVCDKGRKVFGSAAAYDAVLAEDRRLKMERRHDIAKAA